MALAPIEVLGQSLPLLHHPSWNQWAIGSTTWWLHSSLALMMMMMPSHWWWGGGGEESAATNQCWGMKGQCIQVHGWRLNQCPVGHPLKLASPATLSKFLLGTVLLLDSCGNCNQESFLVASNLLVMSSSGGAALDLCHNLWLIYFDVLNVALLEDYLDSLATETCSISSPG